MSESIVHHAIQGIVCFVALEFISITIIFIFLFYSSHTARPKRASEDNLRYIMQIKGVLENTEDPEERITLISNVNQELRGMEVSLATDKKASFVIEKIIKYSNRNQLRLFLAYCKRIVQFLKEIE